MVGIPVQQLHHANVVVTDAHATAQNYARLLGISRWDVHHWTPQRLTPSQAYGYRAEFGYTAATGRNAQGVTFRLVQPTHGFSTFTEYLITRGEGVHSLCVSTLAARELDSLVRELEQQDLAVGQSTTLGDGGTSVMFDTRRALGGFFVEVTSSGLAPAADEVWDFSDEDQRPEGVAWLAQIPRVGHFGVAVSSLTEKFAAYAKLLDLSRWNGVHFHNTPGGLEHATVDGQVVDNAWVLAITDVADFGLELLQGTREPTDYQRTVQRIGEGIHHVLVRRGATDAEWWAVRDWMASMHIGVVMSGRVRHGAAEFFYLDTRTALGGYLLEVLVARDVPDAPPGSVTNWRFDFDFTSKV
jgi:hypothetical protein